MGLSWLWAWCYQHRQNILKVNGSCESEVEDPGSDPCSGAVIPIRHGLELPSLIHFLIAGITVFLSSVLCISNYFCKEEQTLVLVTDIFPTPQKAGVWDAGLECWFKLKLQLQFGQKERFDPVPHTLRGWLNSKALTSLGLPLLLLKNGNPMVPIIQVAEII